MVQWLRASDVEFPGKFQTFLESKREASDDVDLVVREIIKRVRTDGDDALIEYTSKFDRQQLTAATLAVSTDEINATWNMNNTAAT